MAFEQFENFEMYEPGPSHTQETLVNPTNSHQVDMFEPLSQSTSANRRHSGNTATQSLRRIREQNHVIPPSPSPSPAQYDWHSGNLVFEIDPTSGMVTDVVRPQPSRLRPRLVKGQRMSAARTNDDSPYRNKRSRFRSIEPVPLQDHKRKSKIKKDVITEEVEEEDVENLLKIDESNQSTRVSTRQISLETDDAQTRRDLRSAPRASPLGSPTFKSRGSNASDVLRNYEELTSSSRYMSISSTMTFPLPGTMARKEKRVRQEIEKYNPYKPLHGTRAADLAGTV